MTISNALLLVSIATREQKKVGFWFKASSKDMLGQICESVMVECFNENHVVSLTGGEC